MGYIDQARSRMEEALSEARRVKHAHSLAHVFALSTWLDLITNVPSVHLDEFLALSTEHHFPYYLSVALAFRGRSLITHGQIQEGFALLTQAQVEFRAVGAVLATPMLSTWLAEAHAILDQPAEEASCLAEAARIIETTEERFLEAELISGPGRSAKG